MKLIAVWSRDQDISVEDPHTVVWQNGSSATTAYYREHKLDTHEFILTPLGAEMHISPGIIAIVSYDDVDEEWLLSGRGVLPIGLGLTDPDATDHDITAALYTLTIVYRAHIRRKHTKA
jgi:hypothetical protein